MNIWAHRRGTGQYGALLLVGTLALAGCGSSDGDGGAGADGAQVVEIGTISDLTGPASVIGLAGKEGQEVAVKLINADTKTYLCSADREVKLTYDDGTNAPTTAVTIARNYASSGKYSAVIGPLFTAQAQAMGPIMTAAKIPMLVPYTPGSKELSALGDYVFAQSQPDSQSAATGVDALLQAWPETKTVGIVFAEDTAANVAQEGYVRSALEKAGKTVVSVGVPFTSTDMASAVSTLDSKDADAVYSTINSTATVALLQQATRSGYEPHWFGYSTMFSPSVITEGGKQAEGALLTSDYDPSLDSPLVKKFQDAYQTEFNKQPDSWAALGFQSVMTTAGAICDIDGEVNGEAMHKALTSVKAESILNGGTFSFDGDRLNATPPAVLQIKDGKFVTWQG